MSPSRRSLSSRRAARVVALQTLFEVDTTGHDPQEVLERRIGEDELGPASVEYARELVVGVLRHVAATDRLIQRAAPAWPFEQMARIDRNLIRIALYECLFREERIPFKVAVNEAVEMAKLFGSESSSRFVNGVIGKIVGEETSGDDSRERRD